MTQIELVAEFATGDAAVVDRIVRAVTQATPSPDSPDAGATVVRRLVDADLARSALIIVAPAECAVDVGVAVIRTAVAEIQLAADPRTTSCTGAAECLTLSTLGAGSGEESVALAWAIAKQTAESVGVPAYLFGAASVRPGRKDVSSLRLLGREALTARVPRESDLAPDFGAPELHPTAGCVFVGARGHRVDYQIALAGVTPAPAAASTGSPTTSTEAPDVFAAPLPFLDAVASNTPLPGGGCAAALSGASGAALVAMVANLTMGRPRYADVHLKMEMIESTASALRTGLQRLVRQDAEAYEAYMAALRLPKETDDETAARKSALADAALGAALVPLEVARRSVAVLELAARVVETGNRNAASDGGVGALLAHAAVRGAVLNVLTNLPGIEDEAERERVETEARALAAQAAELEARALAATGLNQP